jgi:2-methylcitrate dehydratase PrpD
MQSKSNYTRRLVEFATNTEYKDLPDDVVYETKRLILDTIGCAVGSNLTELGKIVNEVAEVIGGAGSEGTIWGSRRKSSSVGAAFVNAELANAMDADETLISFTHLAGSVIPPAMAAAEQIGASGKDLITAVAIGYDVASRIGVSMPRAERIAGTPPSLKLESVKNTDFAWHVFGSASATGKILRFDEEKMANAFGISGVNAPINATIAIKGYTDFFPMTKYTTMGYNALIGMTGAILAERGFTGSHTVLDGEYGFFRLVGINPVFPKVMTQDLGAQWWVKELSYKPYPINRIPQPALDAFYEIIKANKLKPEDIKEIIYRLHPRAVGHFDHWGIDSIETSMQFSFCFPMGFAMAAYGIEPGPDWHSPENINDPKIKEFAKKVKMVADPNVLQAVFEEVGNEPKPVKKIVTTIEVTTADGKTFSDHREYAKGDPWSEETYMTDEELSNKFRNFTKKVLPADCIEAAIRSAYELEKIENIRTFSKLLIP